MKISIFITQLICCVSFLSYGQNADKGKFTYERQTLSDDGRTESQIEYLFYSKSESMYVIYGAKSPNSGDTTLLTDKNGRTVMEINKKENDDLTYYMNFKSNELLSTELLSNGQRCYVQDVIPKLNWKLLPEKKQIGSYRCQRASALFRCAEYEAWFTTDIPLSVGPWKVGGLPGLIVSLSNKRTKITYKLLSAKYPLIESSVVIVAPIPSKGKFMSFKDFATKEKAEQEKMITFLRAKFNGDQKAVNIVRPECYDEK